VSGLVGLLAHTEGNLFEVLDEMLVRQVLQLDLVGTKKPARRRRQGKGTLAFGRIQACTSWS